MTKLMKISLVKIGLYRHKKDISNWISLHSGHLEFAFYFRLGLHSVFL